MTFNMTYAHFGIRFPMMLKYIKYVSYYLDTMNGSFNTYRLVQNIHNKLCRTTLRANDVMSYALFVYVFP
jgi:hypothetical protein